MDNMPAGAEGFAKAYKPPPYDRAAAKPPASYTHTVCELISGKPAEVEVSLEGKKGPGSIRPTVDRRLPIRIASVVCMWWCVVNGKAQPKLSDEADQDAAAPRPHAAATVFIDCKTNVTFSMADQLQSILGVITSAPLNGQGALTGAFLESIVGYWEFTLHSNYRFDDQAMQLMLPSIQQGQVAKNASFVALASHLAQMQAQASIAETARARAAAEAAITERQRIGAASH
ncbi:hypothetical protein OEZ86_007029 [Tetradesmus obliquus]|nr:hypothetical protein OEZ86_007029 [Tetradesmus obliquus]